MSHTDVVRAWKDPEYRRSLPEGELAALPAHPAGLIELDDEQLDTVAGARFNPTISCNPYQTCFLR